MVARSACDPQRHLASIVRTWLNAPDRVSVSDVRSNNCEHLAKWCLRGDAAAVHLLLGTANLVFWELFVTGDALVGDYVTTSLHWLFVGLQLFAAATASRADQQPE